MLDVRFCRRFFDLVTPKGETRLAGPALGGFVRKLQRDHQSLQRPQDNERKRHGERYPQERMDPIGRLVQDFHGERAARDDKSNNEHNENGGAIARIREAVVEPAFRALLPQREEAPVEAALTTARAPAKKASGQG